MKTFGIIVLQALGLLALGTAVGLAANALRVRDHIDLNRQYRPAHRAAPAGNGAPAIKYQYVSIDEVAESAASEGRYGLDLLLDARREDAFQAGHIPGAVFCDPYRLELLTDEVLNRAAGAERVIIYCNGGRCEDSYLLHEELTRRNVLPESIYVFKGGWEEWEQRSGAGEVPIESDPGRGVLPDESVAPPGTPGDDPDSRAPADSATETFQEISLDDALALFEHENAVNGKHLFVDAREDAPFEAGHIPGAVQCDFYRIDYYFPEVRERAGAAEKIVVYCNGGECEDSLYVCGELLQADIPRARIVLFRGGWEEWHARGLPVATGREVAP